MPNKLYQQTDLHIYEDISSGRLNPQLKQNGDLLFLQNLVIHANTKTFHSCRLEEDPEILIENFDITNLGYHFREDAEIEVLQNTRKKVQEFIAKPNRIYPLEDLFDIPDPPDKKSAYFLELISDEFERIKIRANKVHNSACKTKHLALYAYKNIQRAKKIQYDIQYKLAKTHKRWSAVTVCPDAYVIFVLNVFVDRIIIFYQHLFRPFILEFPKDDHDISLPAISVYLKYPYLFNDVPKKSDEYNLQLNGSIFDHQFKHQVDKLKDISEPDPEYPVNTGMQAVEKKSFRQERDFGEGIRLKWHGQLNVLVDVLLQLTSGLKINGRPPLEATQDELRLFLLENFLDKDGHKISPFTLDTYLNPKRDDKRLHPDSPKRIDLSGFFHSPESEKE
jgi:hypothetical protein